ncbi:MAG: sulfatase-like hydrolase/transferase [Candidatus Aminicenantaceae bacterium]
MKFTNDLDEMICIRRENKSMLLLLSLLILLWPACSQSDNYTIDGSGWNLLLVTLDTTRADRLGCYGYDRIDTQNIDGIARSGVKFSRAFAHTPLTLPSHANIFLGTTPIQHGVSENATFIIQDEFYSLAEHLQAYGYSTGAFVGAYPLDSRFGLHQGFDTYDDDYGSQHYENEGFVERPAGSVIERSLQWVRAQKGPWFLWVHCFDPHFPYDPPEPFRSDYSEELYDGEIAYVDSKLGDLFNYLLEQGLDEKTVVVITGDHGESLGEHEEATHGYLAYNSTLWIPLVIRYPGNTVQEIDEYVCHVDIFPTVCDLLSLEKPSGLQGVSLLPELGKREIKERYIYFESLYPFYSRGWAPLRGLISQEEKYIDSPIPELYNLKNDFEEKTNIMTQRKLGYFSRKLEKFIADSTADELLQPERTVDRDTMAKMKTLGYIASVREEQGKTFSAESDIKTLLPYQNKTLDAMYRYENGEVEKATVMLQEIITERNDFDAAFTNLARIYKEQGRIVDALEVIKYGHEKLPRNYEIFLTYISYLLIGNRYHDVVEVFHSQQLRKIDHDPEIWNSLGAAYLGLSEFEKALEAFNKALSIDSNYPVALSNSGLAYYSLYRKSNNINYLERSLENFERAIDLNPDHIAAFNGLGIIHFEMKDFNEAESNFKKALAINPDHGDSRYNLALTYLEKGDKKSALQHFTTYKDIFYKNLPDSEKTKLDAYIDLCRN